MSKISLLIIDDEQPARELIKHYLKSFSDEVELLGEASNGFDALKLIKEKNPRLIFLDVQMPKLTGFEMLELVENPPVVIFSTAYEEYAIRAFEQNAADYLLKPYAQERFAAAMSKALEKIRKGENGKAATDLVNKITDEKEEKLTRIAVKNRQHIHVIPIAELRYVEADGDYVTLHTADGKYLKERTMKYFEQHLPAQQFVRIHRSYIVNVDCVAKIELYQKESYAVHLKSGETLRASSGGYKLLKQTVRL
ncbi:MAG: LytTR family transcriptional regulator DNA-binding domain-containing protein [Prevotellaceae bacterium]|jgi:two-component system LytT family response regulator|nr:LytTR family transcriptional regulator DNA-binding domain-containing protein [Prevotellaceae bacterium]